MAAPSNALLTYQALLRNGYSTVQAIGIMANIIHEDGSFNPEVTAMDTNGYPSRGLFQFNGASYPNAGSMQTGNIPADINSQVRFVAANGYGPRSAAAAGSTGSQVAGNWAAHFERCQGCQPGGSQYQARQASASTVAGWVSSGNWPTSSGSGGPASGAGSGASGSGSGSPGTTTDPGTGGVQTTAAGSECLWSLGFVGCVLSKTQARWIVGALTLCAAGVVMIIGADLLMKAAGLGGSGTGKAVRAAGEFVAVFPGAEGAGVALSAAGGHANRVAAHRQAQRRAATGERHAASGERRAATGEHRADTERSRRRSESRARQYNAQTARSSARASSRARQHEAQTSRMRAQTYQYRAETERQQGAADQRRAAAARRRSRA